MRFYRFLADIINFVIAFVILLLGLRLVLRFFGANPSVPFVQWVYDTTTPILGPFRGIFPSAELQGQFVLEFSTIFAMIIYALIGYFLIYLISLVPTVGEAEADDEHHVRVRRRRL